MNCRHCSKKLVHIFLDLGFAPPSNAYLNAEDLRKPELWFPLKLYVCDNCWLVQTEDYSRSDELFTKDYAYFSSTSTSWLKHAAEYCDLITDKLQLNSNSFVIEVASNDGYLLKNFVKAEIPCLGVEPTESTAIAAEKKGIPVLREFFSEALGKKLSSQKKYADLIIGNNVYAHVPDINDFTRGLKQALKTNGTITLEFPHLLNLIYFNQFDTVYHEHFSYLSLHTVKSIFENAGLRIYDVEKLSTHGGSLRLYGCHIEDNRKESLNVYTTLEEEKSVGLLNLQIYLDFQKRAENVKNDLLYFLIEQKKKGKTIVAYGAAAKGNTLLNYAGIKNDLIEFICDSSLSKQDKYMPGSHIPILQESFLKREKPDFVILFPWNIRNEIVMQLSYINEWNGKFVVAIPEIEVF